MILSRSFSTIASVCLAGALMAMPAASAPGERSDDDQSRIGNSTMQSKSQEAKRPSCRGKHCDGKWPKKSHCLKSKLKSWTASSKPRKKYAQAQLRYAKRCRAVFAYTGNCYTYWSKDIQLEVQRRKHGKWHHYKRLIENVEPSAKSCNHPDWTKMLGIRGHRFRFRAVLYDALGGDRVMATLWWRP